MFDQNSRSVVIVLLILVWNGVGQEPSVPRIDHSIPCPIEIQGDVPNECAYLVVWENRTIKNRTIRLPFVRLKTNAKNPKPDPVLYTAGGPGVSSLRRARGSKYLKAYMVERDFIVFEQRGTRYAKPSLLCPEVDQSIREVGAAGLKGKAASKKRIEAVSLCRDRLIKSGVDLSAYDSKSSAEDIDDLRKVLGIKKLNLFGISYSTRLMLNVMRSHPDGIRSVVLDSVLPPSVNWDETGIDGVVRSLNLLFKRCKNDKLCSTKYPDLETVFYGLIKRLNKKPLRIPVVDKKSNESVEVEINGSDIASIAYDALNYPDAISGLPSRIYAISKGNLDSLGSFAATKLSGDGFIWGMRYSVWCREEMPFQDPDRIASQTKRYSRLKGFSIQPDFVEICRVWNVPPADPLENEPVVSDIPTLVLGGSYDPNTPPLWGKLVTENLSRSFFFEFPDMGHLINFNSGCGIGMIGSFFVDPSKAPDSTCIKKEKRVTFK
ncbi:MAG: alpha/beta fold hydrolase [Pyrinomonadaceae bacterium]|nr:alpha/beta fold hydrolase [Pyrinomonadaceae bacterium]